MKVSDPERVFEVSEVNVPDLEKDSDLDLLRVKLRVPAAAMKGTTDAKTSSSARTSLLDSHQGFILS